MLELPVTIRVPLPEEMEHRPDIDELLFRRSKAAIVEGFKLTDNYTPRIPYSFQAEININNSRLWELLQALIQFLPGEIICQYNMEQDEPVATDYLSLETVIEKLLPHKQELVQDCAMEFCLYAHTAKGLIEIIVTAFKYIRFSGIDKEAFLKCMQQFNLEEVDGIAFVDEFPKITEPLRKFIPSARRSEDVIWSLNRSFGIEV